MCFNDRMTKQKLNEKMYCDHSIGGSFLLYLNVQIKVECDLEHLKFDLRHNRNFC